MAVVANVAINVDASKAVSQLKAVDNAAKGLDGGLKGAATGAKGLGSAIASALGPILAVTTAVATLQKGLTTAFERGAAEQRLKNLTDSTAQYQTALAVAANTASKFGISQTEATQALADVYGRLKGVGFGLKETSQIYDGFNVIAKQSGIAGAEAAGVFFQLSQALGKGKLNGDEFVSVSERMPGLLDAIAQTTGRSRGELSQMAQQGEITSEVLYKALSGSAAAAGDLNAKLTDQQKAFNALRQVSDSLLNTIGKVFAPFVIKGAEVLAAVGQKLSEWWDYLGAKVLPKFLQAIKPASDAFQKLWSQIPWNTIIGYLQGGILNGLNMVIEAVRLLSPIIGFVVTKFAELAQNPIFKFIAEQVASLLNPLKFSNAEVTKFAEQQKQAQAATAATVNQYSSMPEKIKTAAEANSELITATQAVLENVKNQQASIDAQIASLERGASIESARYGAEKAINDLYGQQLERQYELAGSAQERLKIAVAIFRQQAQAAQIEYNQALSNIALEEKKLALQVESAQLKLKEIEAEGQLQILKSKDAQQAADKRAQLQQALAAQRQVVNSTAAQIQAQQQISQYSQQTASAQYQSKILAAQTALEQKLVSDKIGLSQSSAVSLSNNLAAGARQTGTLATGTAQVANNADAAAGNFIRVANAAEMAASSINRAANEQARLNALQGGGGGGGGGTVQGAAKGAFWPGGFKAFAKGGIVNKPTLGLIGEGGEAEYIIPESKAMGFAMNYLLGGRGGSAIPRFAEGGMVGTPSVSIQTGPVTQMNGTNYVTTQDMSRAVQAGVQQTLNLLRNDIRVRSGLGLA